MQPGTSRESGSRGGGVARVAALRPRLPPPHPPNKSVEEGGGTPLATQTGRRGFVSVKRVISAVAPVNDLVKERGQIQHFQ